VVIHDSLANPALLEWATRAELIDVGKRRELHPLPQEEINRILVQQAHRHEFVVRLKGGDPFVFGRGGEEALYLREHGVPFEVVPGITAAIAAPAYAGIPVTHRGITASFTLITGHEDPDREGRALDLTRLALDGTLAFYMAVKNLPHLSAELVALGRSPETPAAIIEWGTYARQRTIRGTLGDIARRGVEAGIEPPAVVLVGEVADLRDQLNWFEQRPLFGLRVAVTHTSARSGTLESRLADLGAVVFEFPTIEIAPVPPPVIPLDLQQFDWVVITSANALEMLFELLSAQGRDARALAGLRLCATAAPTVTAAIRKFHLQPDVVSEAFGADAITAALATAGKLAGCRVLIPRADIARGGIATTLREAGAEVEEVIAYETRPPQEADARVQRMMEFDPELVVFTNSQAARNFVRVIGANLPGLSTGRAYASLGPVTTAAAEAAGLSIDIEPRTPDLPHLIEAICAWRRAAAR
jgi:uroporphyrinogen III methyltransferase/synthase